MTQQLLKDSSAGFLEIVETWWKKLPAVTLESLLEEYPARETAVLSVDIVNGFCKEGNLSSSRVAGIVPAVVRLFERAAKKGITKYVLLQDAHPEDSKEFQIYPPHCRTGSTEAKTVQELIDLPNSSQFRIIPKKTISPGVEPEFQNWLHKNPKIKQMILVGDCTDICVYQLAIFLKCWFIQHDSTSSILIPANCVDTFEIPVDVGPGTLPHPGDLLHMLFLYHMQLNGIRIVKEIQ